MANDSRLRHEVLRWSELGSGRHCVTAARSAADRGGAAAQAQRHDGETPRAAAEREVLEGTGHEVSVREFLGTLAYESRGRTKVVHFWRMEASGEQTYDLMNDVKAVSWLPLDKAVGRLTRGYERAFLANVGPLALEAAAATATPLIFPVRRSSTKRIAAGKSAQRKLLALKPLGRSMSEMALPASASATNMSGEQPIVESGIGKIIIAVRLSAGCFAS